MGKIARNYLLISILVLLFFSSVSAGPMPNNSAKNTPMLHMLLLAEEGPPPQPTIHIKDYFPIYGTVYFIEANSSDPDYIRIVFEGDWSPNNIPYNAERLKIELWDDYWEDYFSYSGDWYSYDTADNLIYYGWWNPGNNHRGLHDQPIIIGSDLVIGEMLTFNYTRNVYIDYNTWLGTQTGTIQITVYDKETVTVPAGTYEAYKVKIHDVRTGMDEGTYETTYWVADGTGIVKLYVNWPGVLTTFNRTP